MEKFAGREELKLLEKEILVGTNKDKFKVFSIETGGGKTTGAVNAFKSNSNKFLENRYVFVTKLKSEALTIVKDINKGYDEPIAIAFMVDKDKGEYCTNNIYDINGYDIVILTHSTYCNISNPTTEKHKELRKIILSYSTLIIDEEINPIKNTLFEFSKSIAVYQELFNKYNVSIGDDFALYIQLLLDELNSLEYKPKNQLHRVNEIDILKCDIDLIRNKLKNAIGTMNSDWLGDDNRSKEEFTTVVDGIYRVWMAVIDNVALINPKEGRIYGYDYNFNYLMLRNNIWLDASASFNTMYKCELFDVVPTNRVIDHSNCKVKYIPMNTTTSSKNLDSNFRQMVADYIDTNVDENNKGLVLTKKAECISLKDNYLKDNENVEFLNFENMRGINTYRDFTQCFYIHTYRMTPAYYVFLYEYFNKTTLEDISIRTSTRGKKWGFEKEELRQLMDTDIVSSMYQGLKRIQRNRNPKAIFHIFTKEVAIVAEVLGQMKGLRCKELIERIEKMPITNVEKIINFIDTEWDRKRITCNDVRDGLDIGNASWSNIWGDNEFIKKMKSRRVKVGYTKHSKNTKYLMKY